MAFVPDKVATIFNSDLKKELSFLKKNINLKLILWPDNNLIIPEYKIHLLK